MEALGLIDAIITTISESPNKSFNKGKVVVEKERLLDMLEKLKLVVQRGGDVIRSAIQTEVKEPQIIKQQLIGETNPEVFGQEGEALGGTALRHEESVPCLPRQGLYQRVLLSIRLCRGAL